MTPIWTTQTGRKIPYDQMDDEHLTNAIAMLMRNAFKAAVIKRTVILKKFGLDKKENTDNIIGAPAPPGYRGMPVKDVIIPGSTTSHIEDEIDYIGIWSFWTTLPPELPLLLAELHTRNVRNALPHLISQNWSASTLRRIYMGALNVDQTGFTEAWSKSP